MEEKKYIELEEVIKVCSDFINGNITQEELQKWGNTIQLRLYIPIQEKKDCANYIVNECMYSDEISQKIMELEMYKFWHILLKYTNIRVKDELLTTENYDLIYPVIGYWLLGFCKSDYLVVIDMIEQITNYTNVFSLVEPLEKMSTIDLKKVAKTDKDILNILKNPELVKNLATIAEHNMDKEQKLIVEAMKEGVLKEINK